MEKTLGYATCDCGRDMEPGGSCAITHAENVEGALRPRKPYARDRWWPIPETCADCNVAIGQPHHVHCDVEHCAFCDGQAFGNECKHVASYVMIDGEQDVAAVSALDDAMDDIVHEQRVAAMRRDTRAALIVEIAAGRRDPRVLEDYDAFVEHKMRGGLRPCMHDDPIIDDCPDGSGKFSCPRCGEEFELSVEDMNEIRPHEDGE